MSKCPPDHFEVHKVIHDATLKLGASCSGLKTSAEFDTYQQRVQMLHNAAVGCAGPGVCEAATAGADDVERDGPKGAHRLGDPNAEQAQHWPGRRDANDANKWPDKWQPTGRASGPYDAGDPWQNQSQTWQRAAASARGQEWDRVSRAVRYPNDAKAEQPATTTPAEDVLRKCLGKPVSGETVLPGKIAPRPGS